MGKRVSGLLLALVMLVSLLAACGTGGSPSTAASTGGTSTASTGGGDTPAGDPQPVQWMLVEYSIWKYTNDLELYKRLEEKGNIELEIIPVPLDSYQDKFSMTIASNDMPDVVSIFGTGSYDMVKQYGPRGKFVPVSDNYDLMPNLKGWIDKYSSSLPAVTAGDGKLYCMPKVRDYAPIYNGWVIRGDLLAKHDIDVDTDIKTMDDYYDALKLLQTEEAGGSPIISARSGVYNMSSVAKAFGTDFMAIYYDFGQKQYINPIATQNCKDAVEFLAKLRSENILHPDWASMSDQDWSQRVNAGEFLAYFDNMQNTDGFGYHNRQSDPDFAGTMNSLIPPEYDGKVQTWGLQANLSSDWAPCVNAESDAVEGILKAWDFFYDDENYNWLNYGDLGDTAEMHPDGYWTYVNGRDETILAKMSDELGIGQNENFYTVMKEDTFYSWPFMGKPNLFEKAVETYADKVYTELDPAGLMQFTVEENDDLKNLKTPLETLIHENIVLFINGVRPMSQWEDFVAEVESFKSAEVVEIYNNVLARVGQ